MISLEGSALEFEEMAEPENDSVIQIQLFFKPTQFFFCWLQRCNRDIQGRTFPSGVGRGKGEICRVGHWGRAVFHKSLYFDLS